MDNGNYSQIAGHPSQLHTRAVLASLGQMKKRGSSSSSSQLLILSQVSRTILENNSSSSFECPKCFEVSPTSEDYTRHLQRHFPPATAEDRAAVDHTISSSSTLKKNPPAARIKRNPVFTGYVSEKARKNSGEKRRAMEQMIALALLFG